ncbi:hypothetical protein GCM10010452_80520 [Crossiella cryophila]
MGEFLQALAALEHQVLEQVRETGAALGFRPEAHVIVHADTHHGSRAIGREQDAQSVGESHPVQLGI